MGSTDANGVFFYDENDIVSPIHTALNTAQSNLTNTVIPGLRDMGIRYAANETARAALVAQYAPTAARPLYVFRDNAPAGAELEFTQNGTTWTTIGSPPPFALTFVGTANQTLANGSWTWIGPMRNPAATDPNATVGDNTNFGPFTYRTNNPTTEGQGIVANVPGLYRISAQVRHSSNNRLNMRILSPVGAARAAYGITSTGFFSSQQLEQSYLLKAGQRLAVQIMQDSGGSTATDAGLCSLNMEFIGYNKDA